MSVKVFERIEVQKCVCTCVCVHVFVCVFICLCLYSNCDVCFETLLAQTEDTLPCV